MSQQQAAARLGVELKTVADLAVSGRVTTNASGSVSHQAIEIIAASRERGEKAWAELERAA